METRRHVTLAVLVVAAAFADESSGKIHSARSSGTRGALLVQCPSSSLDWQLGHGRRTVANNRKQASQPMTACKSGQRWPCETRYICPRHEMSGDTYTGTCNHGLGSARRGSMRGPIEELVMLDVMLTSPTWPKLNRNSKSVCSNYLAAGRAQASGRPLVCR